MIDSVFGALRFDVGWKTEIDAALFGKNRRITMKARAYREEDGLTPEQERAFADYKSREGELWKAAEKLLRDYMGGDCGTRFSPRTLLFERDGGYALLCDDEEYPDEGVAVELAPRRRVELQDDYL